MNIKDKWRYLKIISNLSKKWLYKGEAENNLNYLASRIKSPEYIDKFNFGYFPPSLNSFTEFMDEFGSITKQNPYAIFEELRIVYPYYSSKKSFFINNTLLIPFNNIYGDIISLSGRTMLSKEDMNENKVSKYKHTTFKKRHYIFGLNYSYKDILEKDSVVIVEGQFDFYSSYTAGINNCVALCGSKLTFQQIALLKRFTNNFYILLDDDEAGIAGIEKTTNQSKKYKFNLTKLKVPNGNDIDEFIRKNNWKVDIRDLI